MVERGSGRAAGQAGYVWQESCGVRDRGKQWLVASGAEAGESTPELRAHDAAASVDASGVDRAGISCGED